MHPRIQASGSHLCPYFCYPVISRNQMSVYSAGFGIGTSPGWP